MKKSDRTLTTDSAPDSLSAMSVPQMSEMLTGLGKLETTYENMSGICATLRGLILVEAKARLGHGHFMPFVKQHFGKTHKSATRYMKIAEAFLENGQTVKFAELAHDLAAGVAALRDFSLDLKHPVVAKIARWVEGRGAYQLMLDFPGDQGGDRGGKRKKISAEEEHRLFLEGAKNEFVEAFDSVDQVVERQVFKAPSVTDSMLETSIESARDFIKQASAWLKIPKRERTRLSAEIEEAAK